MFRTTSLNGSLDRLVLTFLIKMGETFFASLVIRRSWCIRAKIPSITALIVLGGFIFGVKTTFFASIMTEAKQSYLRVHVKIGVLVQRTCLSCVAMTISSLFIMTEASRSSSVESHLLSVA